MSQFSYFFTHFGENRYKWLSKACEQVNFLKFRTLKTIRRSCTYIKFWPILCVFLPT